jgi:hypothetical protein
MGHTVRGISRMYYALHRRRKQVKLAAISEDTAGRAAQLGQRIARLGFEHLRTVV